jgi:hypothetical protein
MLMAAVRETTHAFAVLGGAGTSTHACALCRWRTGSHQGQDDGSEELWDFLAGGNLLGQLGGSCGG